ncbi:MAG: GldG family protein [Clostridia bacterium]|nr:GldG family protein [Clostridia bacterium]
MSKKTETKGSASVNKETGAQKKTLTGRILAKKTNLIVFAAIAVAVFVLVNLLAQFIPNIDNTTGGIFTLTDTTKKTLSELNKDVTIYALFDRVEGEAETGPGKRAEQVAILDLYDKYPRVSVQYIDLDRNPSFLLNTVGESASKDYAKNDFIVKCDKNVRHVTSSEIYSKVTQTYDYFYQYEITVGIQAETKFTSAIIKATGETPVIYYSTGFGEAKKSSYSSLITYISDSGYDIAEINLRTEEIPEDGVCMLFMGPTQDLSGEALDKLDRWLKKGHCAFFFMDIKNTSDGSIIYADLPNFGEVLGHYGIKLEKTVVKETGDMAVSGTGGDSIFKANTSSAGSLEKLSRTQIYLMNTRSFELDNSQSTSETEAIISTTSSASAESVENENDSRPGVSVVAASGKYYEGTKTSKIVVFGSSGSFMDYFLTYFGSESARTVITTSMKWMDLETKSNVADSIEAKEYNNGLKSAVVVTETEMKVIATIVMIVIPLIILICGLIVWLRRRHK